MLRSKSTDFIRVTHLQGIFREPRCVIGREDKCAVVAVAVLADGTLECRSYPIMYVTMGSIGIVCSAGVGAKDEGVVVLEEEEAKSQREQIRRSCSGAK